MKSKMQLAFVFALAFLLPQTLRAQVPTSRQIPFNNVATTIAPSTPGQALTIQLWDAATGGNQPYCENQTLDVDANGAITFNFGAGTAPTPPCASAPPGLDPNNFPSGASRFLDVVDSTGASVLPNPPGRIPLNAVAFALSPGPQGPQGVPGQQGPPGVVQAVSAGDASILVGGTAANPTVAVAANGITNANVANGALSAAKIAGTAATLGSNTFTGTQTINGDLNAAGGLTMVNSTATSGNILKGGVPFIHNFGSLNTFIGQNAGNLTMSGNANTATGSQALQANTFGTNNTASGVFALQNNTIGNSNSASGVNTLQNNTTGFQNTASGVSALGANTTGVNNTASGVAALRSNTTGSNNTAVGFLADVSAGDLTNATAIGSGAFVNASNKIRLGNSQVTVLEAQVGLTVVSDKAQKENFQPVDGEEVLKKIAGLALTSWNYIGHDPKQFRHYGPVAQEFFGAFGHDAIGTIGTSTTINSADMDGILMVAVQALEKRTVELGREKERLQETVEALKTENGHLAAELGQEKERLKAENAHLAARIEKLEGLISSYALAAKAE